MTAADDDYDVAVSFAGEHREYVEAVVRAAKALGLRVFYDRDMTNELWGKNFLTAFRKVYSSATRYFVPFISVEYFSKPYPRDEFSYAMLRAVERGDDYILPFLMDDAEIPPELLHPHIGYLRAADHTPRQLAERLRIKVDQARAAGQTPQTMGRLVQDALQVDPTFPADIPDFTNRVDEIEASRQHASTARPVIVFHGMGGVGKSKLAIHLAHGFGKGRSDRLVYLNMRGHQREPIDPVDAVDVLLSRLDIVPEGKPQLKFDQWHVAAARTKAILLLDNVETADQAEPLIPNSGSTLVLITCRSLIGLDAAKFVHVREFDDHAAASMVGGIVSVAESVVTEVAEVLLRTAQDAAVADGDIPALARFSLTLADLLGNRGESAEAIQVLESALTHDMTAGDRSGLLASRGARLRELDDHAHAISTLEEAVALAREWGEDRHTAWTLNYLGLAYEMGGRQDDALRVEGEAQRIYEGLDDAGGVTWVIGYRSRTLESLGRYDEVEHSLLEALEAIRRRPQPALGAEAWVAHRLCEFFQATEQHAKLANSARDLLGVANAMDNNILREQARGFLEHVMPGDGLAEPR
ncbi:TIR domain-containing protein [Actinophytocola oryzae]|uniref:Tetratricopeptide repeat protein n=1 Tax=Actinophytocola oryzae TaxID=502181 RepID=A0A4R7W2E9_9PSEU|nr:TIR domain-containing protein [Actinophytocola oryzae]TDV56059.1 tetratricopeptide repeat protein [Actinophytocola oryzae]